MFHDIAIKFSILNIQLFYVIKKKHQIYHQKEESVTHEIDGYTHFYHYDELQRLVEMQVYRDNNLVMIMPVMRFPELVGE